MFSVIQKILDWFKSLFWKEEMELTLVGLQFSGKTTFVNVIAVIKIHIYIEKFQGNLRNLSIIYSLVNLLKI